MSRTRSDWLLGLGQMVFVVFVLGLAFLIVGALGNMQEKKEPLNSNVSEHEALSLSVITPARQTFQPIVTINGIVNTQAETTISAQVGGKVLSVADNFKPGGKFKAGDTLFQIDPSDYRLNIESANAEIAAAQSSLAQLEAEAKLAIEEWLALYPSEDIPDLAARRPQIDAANARLQSAEATRAKAELSLSRTRIRASADITILETQLSVGQVVSPNQVLGRAYPHDALEIVASLSQEDLETISPVIDRSATITGSARSSMAISGKVVRRDASLDPRTRLATLYLVPDVIDTLPVGSFVKVSISGDDVANAMLIPKTAYSRRGEVWVVSNGRLSPRNVIQIGETETSYVVTQFHAAEGVVISPPINAFEGQEVKIRGEDA